MPPGSTGPDEPGGGVFALAFGVIRPTFFERFVAGFFFFAGFDFAGGAGFDFNDAAARFNFPASAFRVEAVPQRSRRQHDRPRAFGASDSRLRLRLIALDHDMPYATNLAHGDTNRVTQAKKWINGFTLFG